LYGLNQFGPKNIAHELAVTPDGFTTIIMGMFHIGDPKTGYKYGDIMYNTAEPLVITEGKYVGPPDWPGQIANLKGSGSTVKEIYATMGGSPGPIDFETIQTIYNNNHQSFSGTDLEKNFKVFHATFPAIDGIDMDCEETYDVPSFVDFCKMLIDIGFDITFCPYTYEDFWTKALLGIETGPQYVVKKWNLQCYSGGGGNVPQEWADAIKNAYPGRQTDGYIVAGDWVRFFDKKTNSWHGNCPQAMQETFSGFKNQPCLGGGFIWDLDLIRANQGVGPLPPPDNGCNGAGVWPVDYLAAVKKGLGL
jgi:hypothetical protein